MKAVLTCAKHNVVARVSRSAGAASDVKISLKFKNDH